MNDLAIITTYFNYENYKSRKDNLDTFLEFVNTSGVSEHLYIAEILYKDQQPEVNHKNVKILNTNSIIWHKEAAINAIVKNLPKQYTKIMWVDADVMWFNKNWYYDISKLLDTYNFIQPYSSCKYLNRDFSVSNTRYSYVYYKELLQLNKWIYPDLGNTGLAVAHKREFYDKLGLYDKLLTGWGDKVSLFIYDDEFTRFKTVYKDDCSEYIFNDVISHVQKEKEIINDKIGYYDEEIVHLYHGSLNDRVYHIKNQAKIDFLNTFYKSDNGLYEFKENTSTEIIECFTSFYKTRKEDSPQNIEFVHPLEYNIEGDINKFLWVPPEFTLKFNNLHTVKLYFSNTNNTAATSYLNLIYNTKKIERKQFDSNGNLVIILETDQLNTVTFNGKYFIPAEIYKNSSDTRKLSCILRKIEILNNEQIFEDYSLNYVKLR